jgi:hypothetical protein
MYIQNFLKLSPKIRIKCQFQRLQISQWSMPLNMDGPSSLGLLLPPPLLRYKTASMALFLIATNLVPRLLPPLPEVRAWVRGCCNLTFLTLFRKYSLPLLSRQLYYAPPPFHTVAKFIDILLAIQKLTYLNIS